MLLPATINQAVLGTILSRLALLFLTAAGDPQTAHAAAIQMLGAYNPQTEEQLVLAADIINFRLHALEALSQAANPELSLNKTLRLRGSAVSLSREAHKSQRKLDQLQHPRAAHPSPEIQPSAETQPEPTSATPANPKVDMALALVEAERRAKQIIARDGGKTWSQSFQKRQMAQRMAEKAKKHQATQATLPGPPSPAPPSPAPPSPDQSAAA